MEFEVKKIEPESKEQRPVRYQLVYYETIKDRQGNDVEVIQRVETVTLEVLQTQLVDIQAKVDAIKALTV